jgi:hypothetical protein
LNTLLSEEVEGVRVVAAAQVAIEQEHLQLILDRMQLRSVLVALV